ncbi:MAG TPA: peptidase dimerization domain-containing protein [Longimicrobiales bacterium]|nr:peptidase dimerization domain-containing protein [Longimicrobiales bacterium]
MRYRLLAYAAGLSLAAAPTAAQTTATERAAAADVIARIEQLQTQLQPTKTAEALVARKDAQRDHVLARVEELWRGDMIKLSDWIGRNPEVGWKEYKAVDTLTKVLRARGFSVETGSGGLETAFVGSWDSPAGINGPTLGVIVEYDALRSTTEPFHGCQHNAQSPVGFSAAFAIAEFMKDRGLPGRVKIYGTPAEEVGPPAKEIMWREGVFKGADILVRSHGGNQTARARAGFGVCCLNIDEVKYIFKGKSAHQRSSWDGRNALSAAVHFYALVDAMRPSFRPEASIQGVIPEGGVAPNVVPDRAVVDYYIRYPDEVYLKHIVDQMANAARGAALATGTEVEIQTYGRYRDGITLGTLEELSFAFAKSMNAPKLEAEPQRPDGYEETGFVSRDIPGVGVGVFTSPAPGHSLPRAADALSDVGHTGFLLDAKIMAGVLYHFLTDAKYREAVKQEHRVMAGLFDQYLAGLRKAYSGEISVTSK